MWALSAFQNLLVCWTEPVNQQKYQALREERKITTVASHRLTVSAPPCPFQKDLCDCIQGAFLLPRPLQRGPRWEERESVQRSSQGPPRSWMSSERGVFWFACNHRGSPKSTKKLKGHLMIVSHVLVGMLTGARTACRVLGLHAH